MNKLYSFIGLAKKAGKIAGGELAVSNAIKQKTTCLLIGANDASENTKKKLRNSAKYYGIPLYFYGDKYELGKAVGEEFRVSLAVLEEGFATKMIMMLQAMDLQAERFKEDNERNENVDKKIDEESRDGGMES